MRSSLSLVALVFWFAGCGTSQSIVATVGRDSLSVREFEDAFARQLGAWERGAAASEQERRQFLDQMITSRLKVLEALRRGLDQDSSVVAELAVREQTLATSVLVEREVVEPGVRRMIERAKHLRRVAHILLELPKNPTPADTLRVWNRAKELIALAATLPFDSLAREHSQDKSVTMNGGDLGFVRLGRLVPEFEDACDGLKPGEINATPVRTPFGYHVVKLIDIFEDRGPVHLSHLLLPGESVRDRARTEDTLKTLYARFRSGTPWEQLLHDYHRSRSASDSTGDAGEFNFDELPPDLAMAVYATPAGSLAPPYYSTYGAHVFRINAFRGITNVVERERSLRQQYQQTRFLTDYAAYLRHLKTIYQFRADTSLLSRIIARVDSTNSAFEGQWRSGLSSDLVSRTLLTMEGRSWTVDSVLTLIERTPELSWLLMTSDNLRTMLDRLGERLVLEEHARHTSWYREVLATRRREHREQVLTFRLEQLNEPVNVTPSDSALRAYYEMHRNSYVWPARVNLAEIALSSESLVQEAMKRLRSGQDFLTIAESMTMRPGYRERRGVWGWQLASENELTSLAVSMAVDSISGPVWNGGGFSLIKVLGKEVARPKTFEEAKTEVIPAFEAFAAQERESAWIEDLRARFGVTVDDAALRIAFSQSRTR